MKRLLFLPLLGLPLLAAGQQLKPGYVDWGVRGPEFPSALASWQKGDKWTSDDNFFISRVKPKPRFRNTETQIFRGIDKRTDKRLMYWVPINTPEHNALPDGRFNSDVFPMWAYVDHFGNWTTTLVRIPGNFLDVAHKNGVAVTPVASIPYGKINEEWEQALDALPVAGAAKMADYLDAYGVDGLSYNSEFIGKPETLAALRDFHAELVRLMKDKDPVFENVWYDGTNDEGKLRFDNGLTTANDDNWGYGDNVRTSLFFNYNWNKEGLLSKSLAHAGELGRSSLDIYCGINMQGGEPKNGDNWPELAKYPVSIGLWGAHEHNMLFESRTELGTGDLLGQQTYLTKVERWFSGGNRNPANCPPLINDLQYGVANYDFPGMARMMTARSVLSWDLGEEPFITSFNLGNGRFFNWQGKRQHDKEWYNIGVQDYMPTWMWWFSTKFLGRGSGDVPATGLDAEFVWDEAWTGGSLVRLHGSTPDEYLHLFKTEFALRAGDRISVTYKMNAGSADAFLALSVKGDEGTPVAPESFRFLSKKDRKPGIWQTAAFTVDDKLDGKELAMIALHFKDAEAMDMRLGELSIIRGDAGAQRPAAPVIESAALLSANRHGVDGKIIFNMPNDKGNDRCLNLDVKTSMFKLWARREGGKPVLMGLTTSWAGLVFAAPVDVTTPGGRVSFGVSAVSLDRSTESETAWSEWFAIDDIYETDDEIERDKSIINVGQPFEVRYKDPRHEAGEWTLTDSSGHTVATAADSRSLRCDGLKTAGNYNLRLRGKVKGEEGREETVRDFPAYIQVTPATAGSAPELTALTLADKSDGSEVPSEVGVDIRYESVDTEGHLSRGIKVRSDGAGFHLMDSGIAWKSPFTLSFWIKPESFDNKSLGLLNIRNLGANWPRNVWGWMWHTVNEDGTLAGMTVRISSTKEAEYRFEGASLSKGNWHHMAYVFDFDNGYLNPAIYIDGQCFRPASYKIGDKEYSGDEMHPLDVLFNIDTDFSVTVGGNLNDVRSVQANVDELAIYDKALTKDEVGSVMLGTAAAPEPAGLFDFESDAGEDNAFVSTGKVKFEAGMLGHSNAGASFTAPEYCSGSPFVPGTAWTASQSGEWSGKGFYVLSQEDRATDGSAKIEFAAPGEYDVNLTLRNEYGSDSRSIRVKAGASGVAAVSASTGISVTPTRFERDIDVTFGEEGDYTVTLTSIDGATQLTRRLRVISGETRRLTVDVPSGLYILSAARDGESPATAKLMRK